MDEKWNFHQPRATKELQEQIKNFCNDATTLINGPDGAFIAIQDSTRMMITMSNKGFSTSASRSHL